MNAALIWLAVGIVLLIMEVVGAAGFLVGAAAAAFAMALVTWMFDLSVGAQLIFYAISATLATLVYIKYFRSSDPHGDVDFHDRISVLTGTQFVLDEELNEGQETRVQIGDSLWRVKALDHIQAGARVQVAGGESTVLEIEPLG